MNTTLDSISILYEDADYVVINKPAGIVVHPDGKREGEKYVTDWFVEKYPASREVGEPVIQSNGVAIERSGIVHRIDRDTSGVLVLAKTAEGHAALKSQFQDRTVTKKYLTFVYGQLDEAFGIIDRPIGRSKNDFRKWSAQRGTRGEMRDAETWYTTIKATKDASFLLVEPKTGRTHQIRVHFTAINHPIICDGLYAANREHLLGFERTALHALRVSFTDLKGGQVTVAAPLPADFLAAAAQIGAAESKLKDLLK